MSLVNDNELRGALEETREARGSLTGTNEGKGAIGFKGEQGYSAYEIAVKNGYEGTEQEWIEHFGLDLSGYVQTSDVVDNLTSTYTTRPLSAKQGKNLQDNKVNKSDIADNLTTAVSSKVLSAKQGNVLSTRISPLKAYSTSEQEYGTWIDGSIVYKKTISVGQLPSLTGYKNKAHSISNLKNVVRYEGWAYSTNSGNNIPVPYAATSNINQAIAVVVDATNVKVYVGTDQSAFDKCYITLYYTKSS